MSIQDDHNTLPSAAGAFEWKLPKFLTFNRTRNTSHRSSCEDLVEDAESLLEYAAQSGIEIEPDIHAKVSAAKKEISLGTNSIPPLDLLIALTKLSEKLKPVSAESLRICASKEAKRILWQLPLIAVILTIIVVAYSIYAFMASAICDAITKDIDAANALAVTLTLDVQQPAGTSTPNDESVPTIYTEQQIKNLQRFTATARFIGARALELKRFNKASNVDGAEQLQLPADLTKHRYAAIVRDNIAAYQLVRHSAQRAQESVLNTFGAMTAAALPMLYALLGATAYLMRLFDAQIRARIFTGGHLKAARWTTAAIAGAVIGLFTNFTANGITLPPLALAFLVGYGVDAFFNFLDRLLQTTGQTTNRPQSTGKTPATDPVQTVGNTPAS